MSQRIQKLIEQCRNARASAVTEAQQAKLAQLLTRIIAEHRAQTQTQTTPTTQSDQDYLPER